MRTLLTQFVDALESAHLHGHPCGSAFEQKLPPELVLKAMAAFHWALTTGRRVDLFTSGLDAKAVLSGLVLRRSEVSLDEIYTRKLDDEGFARLTRTVGQVARSGLRLAEGEPPERQRAGAFFGRTSVCDYC